MEKKDKTENKFKSFEKTYSLCAFSLAIAFMYPNRTNIRKRFIIITIIIVLNCGQLFWFLTYTFKCIYRLDIFNFSRNISLAVLVFLFFLKTYHGISVTYKYASILHWMSRDLLNANNMSEEYQKIYLEYIEQARVGMWLWLFIPVVLSGFFPMYSGIGMSIENIKTDDFKRLMVHDMELVFVEHIQNEWPFFHLYFAYNICQCVVLVPNYCGFDGSFCIATTHLQMKYELLMCRLREAFSVRRSHRDLKQRVGEVIVEHQDALNFHKAIHEVYEPWLFFVFLLSSFMISFNLYLCYLLQRFEPKYTLFGLVGVLHIYLPCYYAARLTEASDKISSEMYKVPWERTRHHDVTRMLIIMIGRAQKPLVINGWIVVFNMQLFKSIIQTSYSFFTLISA